MKHLFSLTALTLVLRLSTFAQHPEFLRAERIGGVNNDRLNSIAVDAIGNTYSVGNFSGTIELTVNGTSQVFTSAGQRDILVTKKNTLGAIEWAQQFGGLANDDAHSVACDAQGFVYFTGSYSGTVQFGTDANLSPLTSAGSSDLFIVKMHTTGSFGWANSFGLSGADVGRKISVDGEGNIYVAGEVNQSNSNIYLSKFTSSGSLSWSKTIGGNGVDMSTALTVNESGQVLLCGTFSGSATFGVGTTLTAANTTDSFVALYNTEGELHWVQQMAGANISSGVTPVDVAFDLDGGVLLAGNFSGSALIFGTTPTTLEANGVVDIFYARLLLDGSIAWVKTTGGSFNDQVIAISLDNENNFYATGIINNQSDFDPSENTHFLISDGSNDGFAAKYSIDGEFFWAERFGGVSSDFGLDVVIDPTGDLTVIGIFSGAAYFGSEENPTLLVSAGGDDMFVLTYDVCHATQEALSLVGCSPFELDNVVYTESGTYTYTTTNEGGCLHTVNLELQLTVGEVTLQADGNMLHAVSTSSTLQWINCSTGQAIVGETSEYFQPMESGSYAVEAEIGECSFTSDCLDFTYVGVEEMNIKGALVLYPNPGNGVVRLTLNEGTQPLQVAVMNHLGQRIHQNLAFNNGDWLTLDAPNGVYYIQVSAGTEIETIKYVLQR
jgi:hypothetical protein